MEKSKLVVDLTKNIIQKILKEYTFFIKRYYVVDAVIIGFFINFTNLEKSIFTVMKNGKFSQQEILEELKIDKTKIELCRKLIVYAQSQIDIYGIEWFDMVEDITTIQNKIKDEIRSKFDFKIQFENCVASNLSIEFYNPFNPTVFFVRNNISKPS